MNNNLIERIAYNCVQTIYKSKSSDLMTAAINEGATDGVLLVEEFTSEDAKELEAASKEIASVITSLEKRLAPAGDGWKPVFAALNSSVDGLGTKQIAQMALSGETKKLAKASTEYTKKLQSLTAETSAIVSLVDTMKKNLSNFKSDVGDKGTETIASLSDGIENFPDLSKLDKGVDQAYQIPKWFDKAWAGGSKAAEKETSGGFFKKAMAFIGGMFKADKTGRIVDAGLLADAIKATPYDALMDVDVAKEVQQLTGVATDAGTETTELTAAGAGGAGPTDKQEKELDTATAAVAKELEADLESNEEQAIEAIEEPAKELGVDPSKLADVLKDPEALQKLIDEDEDLDLEAVMAALKTAQENLKEVGDEEGGDAGGEGAETEDGIPIASEEEAEKEVEAATAELKDAAKEAAASSEPPAVAMAKALDNWSSGLSKTSQAALKAKNRLADLKDIVGVSLEDAAKAVEGEVTSAVQAWREEHEETLMKSKRFAKKNFDALEKIVPQIASIMLKKTSESNKTITRGMIRKSVFNYLNNRFAMQGVLIESKRWQTLAGMENK